jgi:hypothetical protein
MDGWNEHPVKKKETTSDQTRDYHDLCHHFPTLVSPLQHDAVTPLQRQKGIVLELIKPLNLTYRKREVYRRPLCMKHLRCPRAGERA